MGWLCVWLYLSALSIQTVTNALVGNHVSSICSTWGREHFKMFDGEVFQFSGLCEYNLVSDCHDSYNEFSVHLRRDEVNGISTVDYVAVTINDMSIHLRKNQVNINELFVTLPYYKAGVKIEQNSVYIKLESAVGIVVLWNRDDAVMVEVDPAYSNRTCGLCGDYNGLSNEFIHNERKVGPVEFGNMHKVHRPNDNCEDPYEEDEEEETTLNSCQEFQSVCTEALHSDMWSSCAQLIRPEPYIEACVQDMCNCSNKTNNFCICSTLSEFSRQCSHAGGQPPSWRTPEFCAKSCPYNMVYKESSPPCLDTCTYQDTSSMCEDHRMDGCFCPPGSVFDDVSMRGCIAQTECQCKHDRIYNSGDIYRQERQECTCHGGRWTCKDIQAPATCSVEEGSHLTTFDGNTYRFHGGCFYTLARVEAKDDISPKFTILAQLSPCAHQQQDTCLKSLKILLNNDKNNVFVFVSDGAVKYNMQTITLPYSSGDINIFQASSFHIIFQSSFGLQIQIQLVPVMQVYVSLSQSYKAKTRGLCGNYNMIMSDDMRTPQGIVEGTAEAFASSWKTNFMCEDTAERLDDPCSLSVENEKYAKHWCGLLQNSNGSFAQCHSEVDPELYYKRCTYATCNCEKSEACLCAVLSSYARACAAKGIFLTDWREHVCVRYSQSCPVSQSFSYNHHRCQLTCRSLGTNQQSCTNDFLPVDGCSCAEGQYMDDNGLCVPIEKCPCHHNDLTVKAGKSINIKNEHCVCTNGVLHCHSWKVRSWTCAPPKVYVNCSTTQTGECALSCLNLDNIDCDSTECESGCQCPSGLFDDGKGSCVKELDCPCQHGRQLYVSGTKIPKDCNTCTCTSGRWECTNNKCPGTCTIYGSGHYSTFDQKTYGFNGHCAYVAVKNNCNNKTAENNFGIITENVPCGNTGATCSKSVRIQLGRIEIKLANGKYEVLSLGHGPLLQYKIRKVGLYIIVESDIGLAIMWDRKTTVRIRLESQHSDQVCGLCGDFDGDAQNDFTTQGHLPVSGAIEFGNSWKVDSSCPNVEENIDPCVAAPNRQHWAKMMCSIIKGDTFKNCHHKVLPNVYYDNCVRDSCACDTGGDCECYCSAIAAYAQACNEAGVCVAWRTPELCPVFCDYYNDPGECKWHYSPCGCIKTCTNPEGNCSSSSNLLPYLEGCYPACPEDKPLYDEDKKECVEVCIISTTTPSPTTTTAPPTTTTTSPPTTTTTSPPTTTTTSPPTTTTTSPPTTTTTSPPTTTTTSPPTTTTTSPPTTTTTSPPTTTTTSPPTTTTTSPTTTTTTSPPTTTTTTSPPTTTTTSPPTTTPSTTQTSVSSTTQCFCFFNGHHYKPGEVIYNMEHIGSGVCLTMICSDVCELNNKTQSCCPDWDVAQNETFFICNCTMARCIENNTIEIVPYECPPLEDIKCSNGKAPVPVYDEYYCCEYMTCDCVCEGWGDPHYVTFDGLYYSYQGNCTYILMEEITPKYGLKIYIDNVYCDPTEDVSCPRSIIISYLTQVIKLKNHNLIGAPQLEAIKDEKTLQLPYSQGGIKIMNTGINLVYEIPYLKAIITFGITGFIVNLPYEKFGKNTQGHCGTCNNNQADDCMLPGGQLAGSCAVMADYWLAQDINQPTCEIPSVMPTSKPEPPPTLTPCRPDSMCDMLHSNVFAKCHPFVSPDRFYQGCVFDSCHVANPAIECTSLQTYAAACAQAGVCLHWRNHTTLCSSNCPSDKVYKPCGPAEQPTCDDNPYEPTLNYTTEGCFCPDGMKLFNKDSGICVSKCGCLDPEGNPREFNEVFEYKCQTCICEETTKAVTCKPKVCPPPAIANCSGPGFVLVNQTSPSDSCCSTFVCQCQSSTCPVYSMNCPIGYTPVFSVPEGKCCPEHTCEPKRVCVHKGIEYQPGLPVPGVGICQDCTCTNEVDPRSGLFKINCVFQQCDEKCDMGFDYIEPVGDECCGRCVQTHCIFNLNGTKHILKQGASWSSTENKCQHFTCMKNNGMFTAVSSQIICPAFEETLCQPNTIQTAANGCCKTCVEREKACKLVPMKTLVTHKDCQSSEAVEIPYCEGSCNTFTKYSAAVDDMQHSCACCKETRFSNRTVDLHCLNGDVVHHSYIHVEECGCGDTQCTRAVPAARKRRSITLV